MRFQLNSIKYTATLAVLGLMLGSTALAQRGGGLKVHAIKEGRTYWVEGGGGNSGIIIGDNGVIVIDAKTTPAAAKQLIDEVAKLTPKPITHVLLTHSDGDHVNGLPAFPQGIQIVATENNLREQQWQPLYAAVEVNGGKCLPPLDRMPTQLLTKEKSAVKIDGINFILYHFAPAHTSGDMVVYLPDDKLVFTGDLITTSVLAHFEKNGSIEGWFTNAKDMMKLDADKFVGGHANEVFTKADLQKRIDELTAQKAKVDDLIKQGKSIDEIKVAMGEPTKYTAGCRGVLYMTFSEIEYWEQKYKEMALK